MTAGEPHREVSRSLGGEPPHYLANILMERGWPHGTKGAGGDPTFPGGTWYWHHCRSCCCKKSSTKLLPVGLATTFSAPEGKRGLRVMAGHIPHHATTAQTEQYLLAWGGTLAKARVLAGIDANEVFTDPDSQGPRPRPAVGGHRTQGPPPPGGSGPAGSRQSTAAADRHTPSSQRHGKAPHRAGQGKRQV